MKTMLCMLLAIGLVGSTALATDLDVSVLSAAGESTVTVGPGATVDYKIVGQLSDVGNLGLALFGCDLSFDGGDLAQADEPAAPPMDNFARNLGITNPAGFGGTMIGGDLIQIGGGQNTINNVPSNADFPIGTVIINVGHSEQDLVTGSLTAPMADGTYTLSLTNLFGNVITSEQAAYWAVEAFNPGAIGDLTVIVESAAVSLVSTMPDCDVSLTRAHDNCVELTFNGAITAPDPGQVTIQALLAGGAHDPTNLSDQFTFTVEPGNVLKIVENGDVLSNETWYGIRNAGWPGVGEFKVDLRVVYGDVDNDGTTGGLDANDIWASRGAASGDCDKYDIDADGTIGGLDANDAWGSRGSTAPTKPEGHTCAP
jgi:hypothetical protein